MKASLTFPKTNIVLDFEEGIGFGGSMKWFRTRETKEIKSLKETLKKRDSQLEYAIKNSKRDIEALLVDAAKSSELVALLKEQMKGLNEAHKKLLDKSIEHTEALIYLQCAKAMDHIKSGGAIKDMDDAAKVLEISRSTRDALCDQRRRLQGTDAFGRSGQALTGNDGLGSGLFQILGEAGR